MAVATGVIASAVLGVRLASKLPLFDRRPQGQLAQAAIVMPKSARYSIEQSRSTTEHEGLYDIRQEARKFLAAHNKKNNTRFKALDPNLKAQYPKCNTRMTVAWVPNSYKLSSRAVFVRCKKSVGQHEQQWKLIVLVSKRG